MKSLSKYLTENLSEENSDEKKVKPQSEINTLEFAISREESEEKD